VLNATDGTKTTWALKNNLGTVTISAFGQTGQVTGLDIRDLTFSPGGTSFVRAGNTLQIVKNGTPQGTVASLTDPSGPPYTAKDFYVAPDGQGGTTVKVTTSPISGTNTTLGKNFVTGGDFYTGSVAYLQRQFINPTGGSVNLAANIPNVFLHGGGIKGGNALQVLSGQNVLDGGIGSNFLVGGTGDDTFFLDGRGGGVSWGTVVNFNKGDAVTFWGWKDGVTTYDWFSSLGASGFAGATIRAHLAGGTGEYDASITFAGVDLATATSFAFLKGDAGNGNTYAYIASI
jgi:hypothetical protein